MRTREDIADWMTDAPTQCTLVRSSGLQLTTYFTKTSAAFLSYLSMSYSQYFFGDVAERKKKENQNCNWGREDFRSRREFDSLQSSCAVEERHLRAPPSISDGGLRSQRTNHLNTWMLLHTEHFPPPPPPPTHLCLQPVVPLIPLRA